MIINVIGKSLPFRGWKGKYHPLTKDGMVGNYYACDQSATILRILKLVDERRLDIKYVVIDDFGYSITNSFMRRAQETGYNKFTEIGLDAFKILDVVSNLHEDLFCFVMMHTEIDHNGKYKPKTIGKMIDSHIVIEGKFNIVFHSLVQDGKYKFLCNNDGCHMAKSPMGMFDEMFIDNDLLAITEKIKSYENEEIEL